MRFSDSEPAAEFAKVRSRRPAWPSFDSRARVTRDPGARPFLARNTTVKGFMIAIAATPIAGIDLRQADGNSYFRRTSRAGIPVIEAFVRRG